MVARYFLYKLGILFTDVTCIALYTISYFFLPFTKAFVTKLLKESDIQVNGNRRSDPKVVDNRFYSLVVKYGYSGLMDAYGSGYFECNDLKELFVKIHLSKTYKWMCYHPSPFLRSFFAYHFYTETAFQTGDAYDKGAFNIETNDDECKTLSIGYWKQAITYEDSITAKHDLIARKLKLKPGMRVLDLGCGEGTLCKFIAENYDVEVTGVNNSKAMIDKAQRLNRGLKVNFKVMDARNITGKFDRITCVGMIEHLGATELRQFFKTVHRCLAEDGIFLLESYCINHSYLPRSDGYTERIYDLLVYYHYYLDLMKSIEGLYIIEDWQNLRSHSAVTLKHWLNKVDASYDELVTKSGKQAVREMKALYSDFFSMGASGQMQVYQIVFSKNGLKDGYETVV